MRLGLFLIMLLLAPVLTATGSASADSNTSKLSTLAIRIIPEGTALSDVVRREAVRILALSGYTVADESRNVLRLELLADSSSNSFPNLRKFDIYGSGNIKQLQQFQVRLNPRQPSQSGPRQSNYSIQGYMYMTGGAPYWNQKVTGSSTEELVTKDWLVLLQSILISVPSIIDVQQP